jgi:uncharacterized protein (DUF2141 family)
MMLKQWIGVAVLLCGNFLGKGQSTIVARMVNLRSDKGVCRVCIFDRPEAFNGKGGTPLQCLAVPVKGRAAEATFSNLRPGTYAVFVFHDANNNDHFDTNWMGIPKEGYGASRNNLPFAAAPSFNNNKIDIAANTVTTVTIRLRNL